jgi:hypothetical protein
MDLMRILVFGLVPTLGCLSGEAVAQVSAPTYEKKASWAETMVSLREQTVQQPGLFPPQRGFGFQNPGRFGPGRFGPQNTGRFGAQNAGRLGRQGFGRSQAPPSPLVDLWTRLEQDFPLECDWMLQDLAACGYPCRTPTRTDNYPLRWFGPRAGSDLEKTLLLHVVEELGPRAGEARSELEKLIEADTPSHDRAWLELYAAACRSRREDRLQSLAAKCPSFVFTKHFNMGGSHYTFTEGLSDANSERHFVPGSALCLLEMTDGKPVERTLLEDPNGVIRDPDVSDDGHRVLFAWKRSNWLDDYHLHELDLASGEVRQLTFGLGFADYEGAYLPDGGILFNSSRCVQSVDCFFTEVSNLYTCDGDGRFLRRLAFDQVHTNYPTITEDGRAIYTRWEYNDRGQIYTQSLFQMNPDGTGQAEFYGNNSYFPTAILHARQIPGTQKVLAVAAGHHNPQMGKLIELDPARGRQENHGARLVAPVRRTPAVKANPYGQEGDLWQYPYPLSETEYLVTYSPWGRARNPLLFGVYFMTIDGRRELLASDAGVSCNQPVPLRRPVPRLRPSVTDYTSDTGTFYVQDVYAGPGLAGIPRGTAKKLRVIGLNYRANVVGGNHNRGEAGAAFVATPIAVAQGSWQAKTIVGETPIYEDGSAFFTAPARTPLYFQVVDGKGHVIQTMRSWATLQPGENASCVGCHEHKREGPLAIPASEALGRRPRKLERFYGPPRGFSFAKEIQPILDRHCTECHNDRSDLAWLTSTQSEQTEIAEEDGTVTAFSLLSITTTDWASKRRFSDGYLSLTGAVRGYDRSFAGTSRALVNWISPQSGPPIRKPYSAGAAASDLMTLLAEGHEGVSLNREETEKLACWIDLVVPYCGDYFEANAWTPFERARYNRLYTKRKKMEAIEERNIRELLAHLEDRDVQVKPDDESTSAVLLKVEIISTDGVVLRQREGPATPSSPLVVNLSRPLKAGDRIRAGGAKYLAIQFDPNLGEHLVHVPDGWLEWTVPAEADQVESGETPYSPSTFQSQRPQLTFRPVALAELDAHRNVAANPYDVRGTVAVFPHATASSECRNDPVYAARNAIDGQHQNDGHGAWPCQSWGPEKAEHPWWQVEFGRLVEIDKVVIVLRADFPHDSHWHRAALVFSDGHREPMKLNKVAEPQTFTFDAWRTSSVRIVDLVQDEPPGWCALTELQVWGRDQIPMAEDLSVLAK